MVMGLPLVVPTDRAAIQQFRHTFKEMSISSDLRDVALAAVGLLNRRRLDVLIVDLQLGGRAGMILDDTPGVRCPPTPKVRH